MLKLCRLLPRCLHNLRALSSDASCSSTAADLAGIHKTPIVKYLWRTRGSGEATHDGPLTVSGSAVSVPYPFSSDSALRDSYMNPWGSVRMGRVFEDLDALAGNIAALHCSSSPTPVSLVTASVDRVIITHQPSIQSDMMLTGRVVWTGKSSMDIQMKCSSTEGGEPVNWLNSSFIFVAQDLATGKSTQIPSIVPESHEEKAAFEGTQERQEAERVERQAQREKQKVGGALALLSWPSPESIEQARNLLLQARQHMDFPLLARDQNEVLLSSTRLSNALICQPQHRNLRGNVFGGFLIRRAFELAHSTAYLLSGVQPRFRELDHVQFLRPVSVGTLLRLESVVLYTQGQCIHVEVLARSTKPETRSSVVSTVFHFTFETPSSHSLPLVLPDSIEDARKAMLQMHHNHLQQVCDSRSHSHHPNQ